jgi:phosphoglycerate dehydrogenase-like enzyme
MDFSLLFFPPQTPTTREFAARIRADVGEASVTVADDDEDALAGIAGADAAFGIPSPALLAGASRLRWLQLPLAAPPATSFTPELIAHPVIVTNMRGTYTTQVAAHAVALLLALSRRLLTYVRQQIRHEWKPNYDDTQYFDLRDATVLLVGLGAVGKELVRLLSPFGCTLIATDAREKVSPEGLAELHEAGALDELLSRADAIIVSVPHTPTTDSMFNRSRFERLKSGALFVNIGRGPVVDVGDLISALDAGHLRAAALDVFPEEPLPVSSPLWQREDVLVTPHVAIAGRDANPERYRVLVDNARRFARGEPLINVVDKETRF